MNNNWGWKNYEKVWKAVLFSWIPVYAGQQPYCVLNCLIRLPYVLRKVYYISGGASPSPQLVKSACPQSLSPLGHSVGFASCKAWCVLISASMPNCPLSPGKGVNTGTGVPATRLGATPKARMLWLLAKSFARCKTSRASNAKRPFLIMIEVFRQSAGGASCIVW